MENEFYSSAGIPPPLHFESSTPMPTWQTLSAAMEIQVASELNCSSNPSPDCFYNPNIDHNINFDSALSSMVSSPVASNSTITHKNFVIRELIGKLGNIGNSGEISPHSQPLLLNSQNALDTTASASYINSGNSSRNTSSYNTPLNSPPKLNLPILDQLVKEKISSLPLNSSVGEFSADPGFVERAARFSCFGSRSFNDRTSQLGLNSSELPKNRYNPLMGSGKLPKVSSSPSLKALGSHMGLQETRTITALANSQDESTLSEQNPIVDSKLKPTIDTNSRKRKAVSKGKSKETPVSSPSGNCTTKVVETNKITNAKRCKPNEGNENEKEANNKTEEDKKGRTSSTGDDDKTSPKPPEPLKDYIHVRARRGQATDSHSLAERVRREKISERMKFLQDIVPGCNKVTGKALMLDEIINYVQSLQRQVEFLSMKLASVNTRLDFSMDPSISKDMFHLNNTLPHQILFPVDSSAQAIYGHQTQQNPQLHSNISNGPVNHFSVDPLDSSLCHLPTLNVFSDSISQYPTFGEDDLQTLVQMGFGQNPNRESALLQSHNIQGPNKKSDMKIEL